MNTTKNRGFLNVALPILVVAFAILIFKYGYAFGQWLYKIFN